MDETRYAPPGSAVQDVGAMRPVLVPDAVVTRLRIALLGVSLYTSYEITSALTNSYNRMVVELLLVAAAVKLALVCGVYCKSRVCALLLLAFTLLPKTWVYIQSGALIMNNAWLLSVGACCLGVYATFEYHLFRKRASTAS